MTDINHALDTLNRLLKNNDWFYEAEIGVNNNLIVYAYWMDGKVLRIVPDNVEGYRVLLHYSAHKNVNMNNYTWKDNVPLLLTQHPVIDVTDDAEYLGQEDELLIERNLSDLARELDRLERICGNNILGDIFFEIHDQKNAVTNLSNKFPEVRQSLENLYDIYGFDIIYEQLEG